jgi:phage terminase large subunit-like protein
MGVDDHGYLLEDASGRYSPEGWAKKAIWLYDKWQADRIIAERNFGGAMVENTIRMACKDAQRSSPVPFSEVVASRGKTVRAEPVSLLYEQHKVHHVIPESKSQADMFTELEDQMVQFSTSGYLGPKSPDRADALVWAFSHLLVKRNSPTPALAKPMVLHSFRPSMIAGGAAMEAKPGTKSAFPLSRRGAQYG